jgi:hypothetical protein
MRVLWSNGNGWLCHKATKVAMEPSPPKVTEVDNNKVGNKHGCSTFDACDSDNNNKLQQLPMTVLLLLVVGRSSAKD